MTMNITFVVTPQESLIIHQALSGMPWKTVHELMDKLTVQMQAQLPKPANGEPDGKQT